MKKLLLSLFVCFLTFNVVIFAQTEQDYELLKKCDSTTSFLDTDFSAEYTLVQDRPGQGKSVTEAIMYRRDKTSNYTIIITSPAQDKGKGYLQIENTVWFYDPMDRKFTFSSKRYSGSSFSSYAIESNLCTKKGILEKSKGIWYNVDRQNGINDLQKSTKNPRDATSWDFLFRFGKGGLNLRLVASYSSLLWQM